MQVTMIETPAQRQADSELVRTAILMLAALHRIHAKSTDPECVSIAAEAIEYASGETAPSDEPGYGVDAAGSFEG